MRSSNSIILDQLLKRCSMVLARASHEWCTFEPRSKMRFVLVLKSPAQESRGNFSCLRCAHFALVKLINIDNRRILEFFTSWGSDERSNIICCGYLDLSHTHGLLQITGADIEVSFVLLTMLSRFLHCFIIILVLVQIFWVFANCFGRQSRTVHFRET